MGPSILAITTASTLNVAALEVLDEGSDEAQSQTSYATSMGEDNSGDYLRVPPIPEDANSGLLFECPYCWTVQTIKSRRAWKRHVFQDLRPYVCTFEGCDLKMFAERTAWFKHELQAHRIEWCCPFCSHSPFQTLDSFERHLEISHAQQFSREQRAALEEACRQSVDRITPEACPFCDEWAMKLRDANPDVPLSSLVVTAAQFQHHIGSHMEQLALFALPRNYDETDASTAAAACYRDDSESDLESLASYEDLQNPPLHIAAFEGLEEEVIQLLEDGTDVTASGQTWGNVLTAAIIGGHPPIVRRLLDHGAKVDLHARSYGLPLLAAILNDDKLSIQMLREAGAKDVPDGSESDTHRRTFLIRAAARGDVKGVQEQLLKNPRSRDISDDLGDLPLHHAAINGHTEAARLLLEAGCDINCENEEFLRPLHDAASKGFTEVVQLFLTAPGCDLDCRNGDGDTPLHNAVKYGRADVLRQLVADGADVNCQNRKGSTPLHYAVKFGHIRLARSLLDAGCEVNCQDYIGSTALHGAYQKGRLDIQNLLLIMGADPTVKDAAGRAPADVPDLPSETAPVLREFYESSDKLVDDIRLVERTLLERSHGAGGAFSTIQVAMDESHLAWSDVLEWARNHAFVGEPEDSVLFQYSKRCLYSRLLTTSALSKLLSKDDTLQANQVQLFEIILQRFRERIIYEKVIASWLGRATSLEPSSALDDHLEKIESMLQQWQTT